MDLTVEDANSQIPAGERTRRDRSIIRNADGGRCGRISVSANLIGNFVTFFPAPKKRKSTFSEFQLILL